MIGGRRSTRHAFPVSLYASLLVALLFLVRPDASRWLQSSCAAVQCLPLRVPGLLAAHPVHAGDGAAEPGEAEAHVARLNTARAAVAAVRPSGIGTEWHPVPVAVRERRVGRGEIASELVLAVERRALGAAAPFVTIGDTLVGFLDERAVPGPDDAFAGAARVALLHHRERGRSPRRVPARIDDEGGPLGVVVEPATAIDRWPLRCVLPEDPYRAASLPAVDQPVRTTGLADDPLGPLPPDLAIGWLRVYGYEEPSGEVVPIGLFVEPMLSPDAIHSVVVWTARPVSARELADDRPAAELVPVLSTRLPVASAVRERWFVSTREFGSAWLRSGAALLAGARLVGVLDAAGLGYGMAAPFGQPGRDWPLTLLPDDGGAPIDLVARAVSRRGELVSLALAAPVAELVRGHAFTGTGGRDLPPGLWIGAAVASGRELHVRHRPAASDERLTVHLHRARAAEDAQ